LFVRAKKGRDKQKGRIGRNKETNEMEMKRERKKNDGETNKRQKRN
jgi:hypothetical protein